MQVFLDFLLLAVALQVVVLPQTGRGQQRVFLVRRGLGGLVEARVGLPVVDDEPALVGVDPEWGGSYSKGRLDL